MQWLFCFIVILQKQKSNNLKVNFAGVLNTGGVIQ